jgi:transposase
MGTRLVNIDRQTPMLMPPDLREWVRGDDLAHFILEALEVTDLSAAALNVRGTGSRQYPPGMMLGIMIYSYAKGIFSSRQIEVSTYRNVSVRYLAGDTHPDHDTIAKFRRENGELLKSVFVQVLRLAKASGLLRMGAVAIDGTKLKASAAKSKTKRLSQIEEEIEAMNTKVGRMLEAAEKADQSLSEEGADLPNELADAQARRERLLKAKAELELQTQQLHQERERQRKLERERGIPSDARVGAVSPVPKRTAQINPTDPQSGLMPSKQQGFIQGYNAQMAVSVPEDSSGIGLIVAAEVVREANDMLQVEPMGQRAIENLQEVPKRVLVDTGYDNTRQILGLEQGYGLEVLCPPARNVRAKAGHISRCRWDRQRREVRMAMRRRLETPENRAIYSRRSTSVEPAFGIVKNAMGFDRFRLRGLKKAGIEWTLVALAFNCRRLAATRIQWN